MSTEDDTYRILRRTPFDELLQEVSKLSKDSPDYLEWHWEHAPDHNLDNPMLTYGELYKAHGWTWKEMVYEARRRADIRAAKA